MTCVRPKRQCVKVSLLHRFCITCYTNIYRMIYLKVPKILKAHRAQVLQEQNKLPYIKELLQSLVMLVSTQCLNVNFISKYKIFTSLCCCLLARDCLIFKFRHILAVFSHSHCKILRKGVKSSRFKSLEDLTAQSFLKIFMQRKIIIRGNMNQAPDIRSFLAEGRLMMTNKVAKC